MFNMLFIETAIIFSFILFINNFLFGLKFFVEIYLYLVKSLHPPILEKAFAYCTGFIFCTFFFRLFFFLNIRDKRIFSFYLLLHIILLYYKCV